MRFLGCIFLLSIIVHAESVFFSIKKANKRYETIHTYIDIRCSPKALMVSIRFKKPLSRDLLKPQNKKLKHKDKEPFTIVFPKGQITTSKKENHNHVLYGQLHINHRKVNLFLDKGICKFSYKNEVIFLYCLPYTQGIEFPKHMMINMAIVFYKNQKEIPRTAVTPGASQ